MAQTDPPPATAAVTTLGGQQYRGTLVDWLPELVIKTDQRLIATPWLDILSVNFERPAPARRAPDPPWEVILADGTTLSAAIAEDAGGALALLLDSGPAVEVPTTAVRRITRQRLSPTAAARVEQLAADRAPGFDVLLIAGQDSPITLRGVVERFDATGLTFRWNDRRVPVPWKRLLACFAEPLEAPPAPLRFTLTNGDTIFGQPLARDPDGALVLRSTTLGTLAIPTQRIRKIHSASDRLVYLSQLEPAEYVVEPLVGRAWKLGIDRGLMGGPLRLSGRAYERGLVMPSRSRVSYRLGRRYVHFAAEVGILDQVSAAGNAAVRAFVDGVEVWSQPAVRQAAPPARIDVPVAGAEILTLEVDYGADLDLGDHVCWAAARLIRR
jgi:hypothetical protein